MNPSSSFPSSSTFAPGAFTFASPNGSAHFGGPQVGRQAMGRFGGAPGTRHDSPCDEGSEDGDEVAPLPGEVNGKGKDKKPEREIKRRSSKACDNCRKSKCKCTRASLPDGTVPTNGPCQNCVATNVECTFNGASRKRGPPKGYIEAIESRLHRMEALLGGLLQNDDPCAQALLSELIGDNEARDILKKDLKAASQQPDKARKSWKLPPLPIVEPRSPLGRSASGTGTEDVKAAEVQGEDLGESEDEGGMNVDRPRSNQRRRLNNDTSPVDTRGRELGTSRSVPIPRSNTIPHTGTATYTLSGSDIPLSPGGQNSSGSGDPESISELADVVGQLSLDENKEVRYHGRSSGLYLISKSQRYRDFFWHFPKPGVWPRSMERQPKTEAQILNITRAAEALPSRKTMDHLLELYWAFVHPVMPVLYKVEFMRQYRSMLVAPDLVTMFATEGQAGGGKVSMLLLLVMFSLAARYSDRESMPVEGEYWNAGDQYLEKAKRILNQDYASSKLTTCQALVLLAYREIGIGAMAESWLYTGMAIRMAQDMGLFRDVDKWFMPVNKFTYDEKQTRKRVWWACVILDKYVSTYIGRPMMIFERDYDTAFPSHDEPDEHEQWHALRPDGSDLAVDPPAPPVPSTEGAISDFDVPRPAYPTQKTYAISCFNRAASLSVLISRIVANIYAIRVRVIGQSSETLLTLLDQNLANWYLELPEHVQYSLTTKKVPPPHVLTLHAQFYTALILLHRPFIPGQHTPREPSSFPSHSICTTAANAIASIALTYSKTFGLRQAPVFMVYYIFTAAILHVYNSTFDPGLAVTAKRNLLRCMNGLKEMESTWAGAVRAWELLIGLVDLHDVDFTTVDTSSPPVEDRGKKRPAGSEDAPVPTSETLAAGGSSEFRRLPSFHTRGMGRRLGRTTTDRSISTTCKSTSTHTRRTSGSASLSPEDAPMPNPVFGTSNTTPPATNGPVNVPAFEAFAKGTALSNSQNSTSYSIFGLIPPLTTNTPQSTLASTYPPDDAMTHSLADAALPIDPSGGQQNLTNLLSTFLSSSTEGASISQMSAAGAAGFCEFEFGSMNGSKDFMSPDATNQFDSSAFFGMPLSADVHTEDWQNYLPTAFMTGTFVGTGQTPENMTGGSVSGGLTNIGGQPQPHIREGVNHP